MRLGDVKRAKEHFDEAINKRYQEVLQVKEWKGELWPQALYFLGESLREQDKEKEAYAYFQRIYVSSTPILRSGPPKPIFVAPRFPKSSA